jgi:hypothetical protein
VRDPRAASLLEQVLAPSKALRRDATIAGWDL